jgi:hypothetical protein
MGLAGLHERQLVAAVWQVLQVESQGRQPPVLGSVKKPGEQLQAPVEKPAGREAPDLQERHWDGLPPLQVRQLLWQRRHAREERYLPGAQERQEVGRMAQVRQLESQAAQ